MNNRFIYPSLILGSSIVVSVFVFGLHWKTIQNKNQTITVTGSAKRLIHSDLAILKGNLTSFEATQKSAYEKVNSQKPALLAYFESKGFANTKVLFEPINIFPQYSYQNGEQGGITGYNASQQFKIESSDVELVKSISLEISNLYSQGLEFQIFPTEFYYTKIAELKIDIQAEAATDAMNRAEKIAQSTKSVLGTMRNARMGVLQITPINSNMVSDYGMNDVSSIDKEITAVVNASFEIK